MTNLITRLAWIALQASTMATPLCAQESATYRQLFDQGVAALGDEEFARASKLFSQAGERAPLAPLWPVYRHLARRKAGETYGPMDARDSRVTERLRWFPTEPASGHGTTTSQLSPSGDRILQTGPYEAALIQAESGALIARLRPRIHGPESPELSQRGWRWTFDESGRVVIAEAEADGSLVGLDVRDASTGRPIEVAGAQELNPTPGARYEWFAPGETPPECRFEATVDLSSDEGLLRCHLVPQADPGLHRLYGRAAVLSSDASLAMLRTNRWPSTLWVIDRRTEQVVVERSPGGVSSHLSPDGTGVYIRSADDVRKVSLTTGEDLWVAPEPPLTEISTIRAVWTFLGDELIEISYDGVVFAFNDENGERREIQRLTPAPAGRVNGAAFLRGGALLILLDEECTACYDMTTGRRRWARGGARTFEPLPHGSVDRAEKRCMILTHQKKAGVVEIDTGESLMPSRRSAPSGPMATSHVVTIEGEQAAVVALGNGELRRVELVTGTTSAQAPAVDSSQAYFPRSTRNGQLWTATENGALVLRDTRKLEPIRGAHCGEGVRIAATSEDGLHVVTTRREPARTQLLELTEDLKGEVVLDLDERWEVAAFSPSGQSLVLAGDGRLLRLDGHKGDLQFECKVLPAAHLRAAAFHGEDQIILGDEGQDFGSPRAYVMGAADGNLIATLLVPGPGMGSCIFDIHSDPAEKRVVLTTSGYITVVAFDSVAWTQTWAHDLDSGNWGKFALHQSEGSSLACVSGPPGLSRVFELSTGAKKWQANSRGMEDLALTSGDRFLIARDGRRLIVMDGARFQPLYRREEASDGAAWILQDDTRRLASGGPTDADDTAHLIHDGWSAPASSFDAWLHDPLELAKTSLRALPSLPVILDAEEAHGPAGSPKLAIAASYVAKTPLIIGAVFEDASGAETFVAVPKSSQRLNAGEPLFVDVPSQDWKSVRLMAYSGVQSRTFQRR